MKEMLLIPLVMSTEMKALCNNAEMKRRHLAYMETPYAIEPCRPRVLLHTLDVSATSSAALRALTTSVDMTVLNRLPQFN